MDNLSGITFWRDVGGCRLGLGLRSVRCVDFSEKKQRKEENGASVVEKISSSGFSHIEYWKLWKTWKCADEFSSLEIQKKKKTTIKN